MENPEGSFERIRGLQDEDEGGQISLKQCEDAAKMCNSMESFYKRYRDEFMRAEEQNWFIHICGHIKYEKEERYLEECRCPFEVECMARRLSDRFMLKNSQHSCSLCKAKIGSLCCGLSSQYGISPMSPMVCRDCDPEWAQSKVGSDFEAVVKVVPTMEDDVAATQDILKKYNIDNTVEEKDDEENEDNNINNNTPVTEGFSIF